MGLDRKLVGPGTTLITNTNQGLSAAVASTDHTLILLHTSRDGQSMADHWADHQYNRIVM